MARSARLNELAYRKGGRKTKAKRPRIRQPTVVAPVTTINDLRVLETGPFPTGKLQGSRAAGISYERKVQAHLRAEITDNPEYEGWTLLTNPWFAWRAGKATSKPRWASPDILLYNDKDLYIIEAKLSWNSSAEPKIRRVYEPLCNAAFPGRTIRRIQVCRNLRPRIKPKLIDHWLEAGTEYVHTWFFRP